MTLIGKVVKKVQQLLYAVICSLVCVVRLWANSIISMHTHTLTVKHGTDQAGAIKPCQVLRMFFKKVPQQTCASMKADCFFGQ